MTTPANDNSRTSLYRHWDADGNLLYVGISLSAIGRLAQHRNSSRWFGDIARVTIEQFDTREKALDAERDAIQAEKPRHNIVHARTKSVNLNKWSDEDDNTETPDEGFSVYIVRRISDKKFHGLFWVQSKGDLWHTFDEFGYPHGFEFAELDSPGGLVHPGQGILIKQFDDMNDIDGYDSGTDWTEFLESELFNYSLCNQDELIWEPFRASINWASSGEAA